ncbi:HECT-domain ubiquitin-transferase domain containing protein [Theileria equi strain WA]|uniref:HECT-domain ubiquitin-transferase domain containing protein n=1 Tax=Theileria equi strain WA TaxID=1537102 RepID=L1LFR7_THEEQ|nr:HECT-domain ubiquitin-transferase domain containing protein [Theileria equi strain WA]EKX74252.1 HECT-domain ubiquitin-transferase domain containing protein [Theileria equi strain WA]|eukprot:XP_004833704.1 HECT-domain ubiquitin-transferase domain containing protein [Theileria equi strain WA]
MESNSDVNMSTSEFTHVDHSSPLEGRGRLISQDIFKFLIYTKYVVISRLKLVDNIDEQKEFLILQGASRTLRKIHTDIFRHYTTDNFKEYLKIIDIELDYLTELLKSDALVQTKNSLQISDKLPNLTAISTVISTDNESLNKNLNDKSSSSFTPNLKDRVELERAFGFFDERFSLDYNSFSKDEDLLYEIFLYNHTQKEAGFSHEKDQIGTLRLNSLVPNISATHNEINGYRFELGSKLSANEDDHLDIGPGLLLKDMYELEVDESYLLSFDDLVRSVYDKLSKRDFLIDIRINKINQTNRTDVATDISYLLRELLDEVSQYPCDYNKWIKLFTFGGNLAQTSSVGIMCDLYKTLYSILEFSCTNDLPTIADLTIDMIFSLSLRSPDICDLLNSSIKYVRRILLPLFSRVFSNMNFLNNLDDNLWLLHHSVNFDAVWNFEYLSLQYPVLVNYKDEPNTSLKRFFSQIPSVGIYISRIDISMKRLITRKRIYKMNSGDFNFKIDISCNDGESSSVKNLIFISNGQNIIVVDEKITVLDINSNSTLSFEFMFDNANILVFLNGRKFYTGNLHLESQNLRGYDFTIDFDAETIHIQQYCTLSPGFRKELLKQNILYHHLNFYTDKNRKLCSDIHSLCDRQLFLLQLSSSIHNVAIRIYHSCIYEETFKYEVHFRIKGGLKLLFELVVCMLDCIDIISSTNVESINAISLWRMISETIISLLSVIRIFLSISSELGDMSLEFFKTVASCLIGCIKYRNIWPDTPLFSDYHLKIDLISLANNITTIALKILSSNCSVFKQLFSTLSVDVASEIFTSIVYNDSYFMLDTTILAKNETLRCLNENDCIAIFTKRAISHVSVSYMDNKPKFKWEKNYWWNLIYGFLEQEKSFIAHDIAFNSLNIDYCTCNSQVSALSLLSPFITNCTYCIKKCLNYWLSISSLDRHLKQMFRNNTLHSLPKPSMLLCRLLLKHGVIFLCLNSSSGNDYNFNDKIFEKMLDTTNNDKSSNFWDWKHNLLFSCEYDTFSDNISSYFKLFEMEDVRFFSYILSNLLKYQEYVLGILTCNANILSRSFLDELGVALHNFINSLSMVDVLSYFVELIDHSLRKENTSMINKILTSVVEIFPLILKVILSYIKLIKSYSTKYGGFTSFMNYIILQFNAINSLFGRIVVEVFSNVEENIKSHLLSSYSSEGYEYLSKIKEVGATKVAILPNCILGELNYTFDSEEDMSKGLRRLLLMLQDFKYEKSTLGFKSEPGIYNFINSQFNVKILNSSVHKLSQKLLEMDDTTMAMLGEGYNSMHSYMHSTKVMIIALFIHLYDFSSEKIPVAIRLSSEVYINILKKVQNIRTLFKNISDEEFNVIRQLYLDDIKDRCLWLMNNCKIGALVSAEFSSETKSETINYGINTKNYTLRRCSSASDLICLNSDQPKDISLECLTERTKSYTFAQNMREYNEKIGHNTKYDTIDIANWILFGPPMRVCESELFSQKISSLTKYAMIGSINAIVTEFSNVQYVGTDNISPSTIYKPLIVNLVTNTNEQIIVANRDLKSVLESFWYTVLSTMRSIVIRTVYPSESNFKKDYKTVPNTYKSVVVSFQNRVLEKICDWYLNCGIISVDTTKYVLEDMNSWIRLSLSFFSLLFSFGLYPMNNPRYAHPIFKHLISILKPLPLSKLRMAISTHTSLSTYTIESAVIVYSSSKFIKFKDSLDKVFNCLRGRKFSRKDYILTEDGGFYLWVKRSSRVPESMDSTSDDSRLHFKHLWSFSRMDLDSSLKPIQHLKFGKYGNDNLDTIDENNRYSISSNELIIWKMENSSYIINDISLADRGSSNLVLKIDAIDTEIPVFLSLYRISNTNKNEIELALVNYLGGKLEIEGLSGNWSQVLGFTRFDDLYLMRCHFYHLFKFLLHSSLTSNIYSYNSHQEVEVGSSLIKLLLRSLCSVATDLPKFNKQCECRSFDLSDNTSNENVSIRYSPNNMGNDDNRRPLDCVISKHCSACSSNLIYSKEIENFWGTIISILIKGIDSTIHYKLVYHILSSLLTTFTLNDQEIDIFLSLPHLGPLFCELFVSCIRKLCQESLSNFDHLVPILDESCGKLVSSTLHGSFLYRWFPPLPQIPMECIYSSLREIFQSVIMSKGYKKNICKVVDSNNDPFVTLPHSEHFVTHRASPDFEADINDNTLHITRASNMGGIVLYRIPPSIGSTTMQGNVNFFILSPGRFGITVAPADCIFGTVSDLFDRNDVVGFMTSLCPPFANDIFAATINYRVGDVLSAYFTVDHQEDGQICLRTELLIAGNSIGSVLEVIYDPITQNDTTRRMSLVFIFQDPITLVHNGMNQQLESTNIERMVTRDTHNSFRSNTASNHILPLSIDIQPQLLGDSISESSNNYNPNLSVIRSNSDLIPPEISFNESNTSISQSISFENPTLTSERAESDCDSFISDAGDETPIESFSSLDNIMAFEWDINYDVLDDDSDDELFKNEALGLCKDDFWLKHLNGEKTPSKYITMFADSVQIYQSILMTNLPLLLGLKDEIVNQMCLCFDSLYNSLRAQDIIFSQTGQLNIEETNIKDSFSWLSVLSCDYDYNAWKDRKVLSNEGNVSSISDFSLPWHLGSSISIRVCALRLKNEHCERLLQSLSNLLSLKIVFNPLLFTLNKEAASRFVSDNNLSQNSLLLALGSKCILSCTLLSKVMVEKGHTIKFSSETDSKYICIDNLVSAIFSFIFHKSPCRNKISQERLSNAFKTFGLEWNRSSTSQSLDHDPYSNNFDRDVDDLSSDKVWLNIHESIKNNNPKDIDIRLLYGGGMQNLGINVKMFSTCDYTYHCGSRMPNFRRHIMRRSLHYKICEHDFYDLISPLLLLCPQYFVDNLRNKSGAMKILRIFRASVTHISRSYDFNAMDYWDWIKSAHNVKLDTIDTYSKSVDPLYGWMRLVYISSGTGYNNIISIFFTELLYSALMPLCNPEYHKLLHNFHWMLDIFVRHPLCPKYVRDKFVSHYIWEILHILMINLSSLPCKLATVASRFSAWLAPISNKQQLEKIFEATQYCGSSAFHRVSAVCHYYGTLDLDSFTNLDLKRHDHSTKLATAILVHQFATTASILMDMGCEPVSRPDDFISFSHYLSIAKNRAYLQQFLRQVLSIPVQMSLDVLVPKSSLKFEKCGISKLDDYSWTSVNTLVTSSRSRSLSLTFHLEEPKRVVFSLDKSFRRIIHEEILGTETSFKLTNGILTFIGPSVTSGSGKIQDLTSSTMKILRKEAKNHSIRLGFEYIGKKTVFYDYDPPIIVDDALIYMDIYGHEINLSFTNSKITWDFDNLSYNLIVPTDVILLQPFASISDLNSINISETIKVFANTINIPLSTCYYSIDAVDPVSWKSDHNELYIFPKIRSGLSLSNLSIQNMEKAILLHSSMVEKIGPPINPPHFGIHSAPRTINLIGKVSSRICDTNSKKDHMIHKLQKGLPFSFGFKVLDTTEFYFGIYWGTHRILWSSDGNVTCPSDPPIYNFGLSQEVTIKGIPYHRGDYVAIHFIPHICSLLFQLNDDICMTLNFKKFYKAIETKKIGKVNMNEIFDQKIFLLQRNLINYIISDDINSVKKMVYDLMAKESVETCAKILELSQLENDTNNSDETYSVHNPIYIACLMGKMEMLQFFSMVPDLNFDAVSGPYSETPLMGAAKSGYNSIISYLICVHSVNVNARDSFGNTPLMLVLSLMFSVSKNPNFDIFNTVELLLDFGSDISIKNTSGLTVVDLLPIDISLKNDNIAKLLEYFSVYPLRKENFVSPWPGLLSDAQIIIGSTSGNSPSDALKIEFFLIDGHSLIHSQRVGEQNSNNHTYITQNSQKLFTSENEISVNHDDIDNAMQYIRYTLERIRRAILTQVSTITIDLQFLMNSVEITSDIRSCIMSHIIGFIREVKITNKWIKNKILKRFVRISSDYCNELSLMDSNLKFLISFLHYEKWLVNIRLLNSRSGLYQNIEGYKWLFEGTNLLSSNHCLYTNDYLVVTHCEELFSIFQESIPTSQRFGVESLPNYSRDFVRLTVNTQEHLFDRIRLEMNSAFTNDMDFCIRSLVDLLSTSGSIMQIIVSMVMTCTTKSDVQSYLPPLKSPPWNGIHISLDKILVCMTKIRKLILEKLKNRVLFATDMHLLLYHLYKIVDNLGLKDVISVNMSLNMFDRIKDMVKQLNVQVKNFDNEKTLSIKSYSNLDFISSSHCQYDTQSTGMNDYLLPFCFILIRDRIELLNNMNDIFKILTPIISTVLNQPIVEYKYLKDLVTQPPNEFFSEIDDRTFMNTAKLGLYTLSLDVNEHMALNIGPPEQPIHWGVYFTNQVLIKQTILKDMYNKIFVSLQSLNGDRPYFSIRVDRGIASTSPFLKDTLWYQSTSQILNSNPNILRAKNNQRPFMVVFKGEGSTDFGGPFQELLTCISNEVMVPINPESNFKSSESASIGSSNLLNKYGLFQDTVLFKFTQPVHPMVYLSYTDLKKNNSAHSNDYLYKIRCNDLGVLCSSGCCNLLPLRPLEISQNSLEFMKDCKCGGSEIYNEVCNQHIPMELSMYEALGRIFSMCICMMNPLNIAINPIIWKKILGTNITLKDISDCDKFSVDLLSKLMDQNANGEMLDGLTFSLESNESVNVNLIENGSNIPVNKENLSFFLKLAVQFRITQADMGSSWITKGINSVIPIGRLRMLLDSRSLEFMVCGDSVVDLSVLRVHTVSSSLTLKKDLFDVLARFNNKMLQLFLRFVSGRSRLPHPQSDWCLYVEYDLRNDTIDVDSRLPTSATCSFRLLVPKYSNLEIMYQRLIYAIENCIAIDLDAHTVHDEMQLTTS